MTKEFDKRNMAKSRRVCEDMEAAHVTKWLKLTERERQILAMWPRFEDGEPVWFGDELVHKEQGHRFPIEVIELMDDGWRACCQHSGVRDVFRPGERVERPAPKVLDADGVEIKVGDTVWTLDGLEGVVTKVEGGAAYIAYESDYAQCEEADNLTHTRADSWGRLEVDAQKNACDYFGVECDSEAKCRMCPHFQDDRDCSLDMNADIVRRAKKLAGVD